MSNELDELNRLFTSKNVNDIINFYGHFNSPDELITWMKNRPGAPLKIYEFEGDKNIVIVIPTADHEGKYAKHCVDIFKGQQIIFVESSGPFFNYARSCNYGIEYALKYKPKWILLSNDDILEAEELTKLKYELSKLDYNSKILVLASQDRWDRLQVHKLSKFYYLYNRLKGRSLYVNIMDKFKVDLFPTSSSSNEDLTSRRRQLVMNLLARRILETKFSGDFEVFSIETIRAIKNKFSYIFDPLFINSSEDTDLYIRFLILNIKILRLRYKVNSKEGGTLGTGEDRTFRDIIDNVYLSYKYRNSYAKYFDQALSIKN